jgi:hypothetical protein
LLIYFEMRKRRGETINEKRTRVKTVASSFSARGAFSLIWKPDLPGKYTLIATFEGSESYYSPYSETSFGVDEAPVATLGPTQVPASMADQLLLPATGGIIAAILAVGALIAFLTLRKK